MENAEKTLEELKKNYEEGRNPLAYIPYSDALRQNNELARALDICMEGIKMDSYSVVGRTVLARIYFDMGHYEDAIHQIKVALRIAPDAFGPNIMFARILIRQRHFNDASDIVKRIEKNNPNDKELKIIQKELEKYFEKAITNFNAADSPDQKITKFTDEAKDAEIKIIQLKDLVGEKEDVLKFEVYKIYQPQVNDVDEEYSDKPAQLIDFYIKSKDAAQKMKTGELSRIFLDLGKTYILLYEVHTFLITIFIRANHKFGLLKKEIEKTLYS